MFRAHVLIIRRSKLHYTASGIITPIGGRLVHTLREDSLNPLALRLDIYSLTHYLCKVSFYEPRRVTLGNTLQFVEE